MVLPLTFFAMELALGFMDFNDVHFFGPRDFDKTGKIFIILMAIRLYQFIYNICQHTHEQPLIYGDMKWKAFAVIHYVAYLGLFLTVFALFTQNE
jgi:hypothetical protein